MPFGSSYDELIQRAKELKNKCLTGEFPQEVTLWNSLLLSSVSDYLPAGVALLNNDFVLCQCNSVYGEYLHTYSPYTPEKALGMCYFSFIPGSQSQVQEWFRYVRDSGRHKTQYEFPLRIDCEGREQISYWDATVVPVLDNIGQVRGIVIFTLDVTEPISDKKILQNKEVDLEESKSALRAVLKLGEEERARLERKIEAKAKGLILPFLESLRKSLMDADQITYIDVIESNLKEIISEFSDPLRSSECGLTPREIQIAAMITEGKTTKEIAQCLLVSPACIDFHRNNIRAKLGLKNRKVNLRSFLLSLR